MQTTSNRIVSVIVVTCGAKDYLWACLAAIKKQVYPLFETIVIDNSPSWQLREKLSRLYPDFKICRNEDNFSYCDSLNQGIGLSRGAFVLCLNYDVILGEDFIRNALEGFSDPRAGMVSGKILRMDGRTLDSTGLFPTLWRTAGERGYSSVDKGQFDKDGYIFGVTGAAAFYRREALESVKETSGDYFDSRFRFFYEDLDLAWRLQAAGWKGYYLPRALARHLRGGSVRQGRGIGRPYARRFLDDRLYLDLFKNRYLTLVKNETLPDFLLHLPFLLFYELISWGYTIIFRPWIIAAFFSFLRRKNENQSLREKPKSA